MKALLLTVAALILIIAATVATLIGSSYRAASEAIRHSSASHHPELLQRAVLAAETSHQPGAASITQQFAKDYTFRYNRPSRNITFNIRELLLSTAISARFSPTEVLSAYIDHVYMGQGIEGLPAAARVYFAKAPQELDASECALLAGLIRSPRSYSPITHPQRAVERRNAVLKRMLEEGVISRQTFDSATHQAIRPAA